MKVRSFISVFALLLTTLLWSCGGSHDARITAVLDRADSLLLISDPALHDSVRQELEALDTARALKSDEMLRARHALLLVQARYKCYVTIPADSALIDAAYRYYADHHSSSADYERYTRTLIYQGAVAEELGHPQQAIQWYLKAEQAADPNDHFNLGYASLRIASLYQAGYTTDSTDLIRLKQALPHFRAAGNDYWQAICLTGIGGLYRTHNNDSALHYIQQAISFSKERGLTYNYYEALDKLCGLYYYTNEYKKSKDVATQIFRENQGTYDGTQYLSCGIRSFAKLGMADSAENYLKLLPAPQSKVDSMEWFFDVSEVYRAKGDYRNYSTYEIRGDSIADMIMLNSYQVQLKDTEEKYNNTELQLKSTEKQRLIYILLVSLLALLAAVLLLSLLWYRNKTRHSMEKELLIAELEKSQTQLDATRQLLEEAQTHIDSTQGQLAESQEQLQLNRQMLSDLQDNVDQKLVLSHEIMEKIKLKDHKTGLKHLLKEYSDQLSISDIDESLWQKLRTYADSRYNNLTERWQSQYPALTEEDFKFIYLCCIDAPNVVIMLYMDYTNIHSVTNNKRRITQEKMNLNESLDTLLKKEQNNANAGF
ncbi:MAG: hypothetical protein J5523_03710 [Muribaculaceae bacterium]|nr:hypothetical protein [Muribaculaceae bacterium]